MILEFIIVIMWIGLICSLLYALFIIDKKVYKKMKKDCEELKRLSDENIDRIDTIQEKNKELSKAFKKYINDKQKEEERLAISLYN